MPGYTMQKEQLQTRLRRIEGQVRGVARMIDEDKYCVDVVTQVAAIQAALDKVSLGLLDGHIRGCVRRGDPGRRRRRQGRRAAPGDGLGPAALRRCGRSPATGAHGSG